MSRKKEPADPETYTRALFLGRLQRLIRARRVSDNLNPLGLRLLDRAIDATYRDCIDYGVADQARPIMAAHRAATWHKHEPPNV